MKLQGFVPSEPFKLKVKLIFMENLKFDQCHAFMEPVYCDMEMYAEIYLANMKSLLASASIQIKKTLYSNSTLYWFCY